MDYSGKIECEAQGNGLSEAVDYVLTNPYLGNISPKQHQYDGQSDSSHTEHQAEDSSSVVSQMLATSGHMKEEIVTSSSRNIDAQINLNEGHTTESSNGGDENISLAIQKSFQIDTKQTGSLITNVSNGVLSVNTQKNSNFRFVTLAPLSPQSTGGSISPISPISLNSDHISKLLPTPYSPSHRLESTKHPGNELNKKIESAYMPSTVKKSRFLIFSPRVPGFVQRLKNLIQTLTPKRSFQNEEIVAMMRDCNLDKEKAFTYLRKVLVEEFNAIVNEYGTSEKMFMKLTVPVTLWKKDANYKIIAGVVKRGKSRVYIMIRRSLNDDQKIVQGEFDWICTHLYDRLNNYFQVRRPIYEIIKE